MGSWPGSGMGSGAGKTSQTRCITRWQVNFNKGEREDDKGTHENRKEMLAFC